MNIVTEEETVSPAIIIEVSTKVVSTSKEFLRNNSEKEGFINFISTWFEERGIEVKICQGDDDVDIFKKLIQIAQKPEQAVVSLDEIDRYYYYTTTKKILPISEDFQYIESIGKKEKKSTKWNRRTLQL